MIDGCVLKDVDMLEVDKLNYSILNIGGIKFYFV